MDDKGIIELFFQRDEGALCIVKQKFGRLLTSVANGLLKNSEDSEECVNDALLAAWNAIPPASPENLGAYLCRITRNLSLKRWREKTAEKRGGGAYLLLSELDDCLPDDKSIDDAVDEIELSRLIDSFLRSLESDELDLFILRYFYFCSVSELAERFGFSKSKVKTQLYRTRKKLSARLEKEGVII